MDVPGATAWTRTSVELRDGQEVWFESRGEVRWGPGRKDGPGGESGSPRNPARPIPSRPGASLIGRIGESGDPFFIGSDHGPIKGDDFPVIPEGEGCARIEGLRGEVFYYVASDGSDTPARIRVRTPTFANMPTAKLMVIGQNLADVPLIQASIDPCYSCTDR